jgi:hypothetical protein
MKTINKIFRIFVTVIACLSFAIIYFSVTTDIILHMKVRWEICRDICYMGTAFLVYLPLHYLIKFFSEYFSFNKEKPPVIASNEATEVLYEYISELHCVTVQDGQLFVIFNKPNAMRVVRCSRIDYDYKTKVLKLSSNDNRTDK